MSSFACQSTEDEALRRELLIEAVGPAIIFLALWLDGWFYPLLLLPFLYVILVEKKTISWLGFRKQELKPSISLGLLTATLLMAIHYPIFMQYIPLLEKTASSLYDLFTDVVWYPLYEETAYRSFLLVHFADFRTSSFTKRNLLLNSLQAVLFLSIHRQHVVSGRPLVLVTVLVLALVNGLVFLKTRNISGCILSHCAINGFALFLRGAYI